MDWYTIFKFLHVVSAVCWVGGGTVLVFLGARAARANDPDAQMIVTKQVASLATSYFIPASLATVIFGLIVATIGNLWSNAWVVLGLLGFVATFCTGNFLIRPTADAIAKAETEGRREAALAGGRRLLGVAKFDHVMLFTVIGDMVLKPQWSDVALLAIAVIVLVVGAVLYLLPAMNAKLATA